MIMVLSRFVTSKYGLVLVAAALAVQLYVLIGPNAPALDNVRAATADEVTSDVAATIGVLARDTWASAYVHVAPLVGDHGDHVRARIERALPDRVNCTLVTDTVLTDLRNGICAKTARLGLLDQRTADRGRTKPIGSLEEALEFARKKQLDYVVYGRVRDFRRVGHRASLTVDIAVADAASATRVLTSTFSEGAGVVYADVSSGPSLAVVLGHGRVDCVDGLRDRTSILDSARVGMVLGAGAAVVQCGGSRGTDPYRRFGGLRLRVGPNGSSRGG